MSLDVNITKRLPDYTIDVAFSCRQDELLAMIGPSGAGKTTIIRIIAGLEKPDSGRITFNGKVWLDTVNKIFLPPRKRGLGYVFQDYALFPHLNVAKNIAFAAKSEGATAAAIKLVDIAHLGTRRIQQISGGERQRVALAQALAGEPQLLLLDEPFSALDVVTRTTLRNDLKQLKTLLEIPVVHVTHDLEEAAFLTDYVLSVEQGRLSDNWLETHRKCRQSNVTIPINCRKMKCNTSSKSTYPEFKVRESNPLHSL